MSGQQFPRGADTDAVHHSGTFSNGDGLKYDSATGLFVPATFALSSALASYQPLDSDLTAIAALSTTSFGRALLALADAAAGRTALGLGSAALSASSDFQPSDPDLTAIAALTTTATGRSLLAAADAAAIRTIAGAETSGAAAAAQAASQPLDADLTAISALTTTSTGRSLLAAADAAAIRTIAGAESTAQKGVAGGYASLDGGGKVPVAQLPSTIMEYQGTWNASTNSPALADGGGSSGDVYRVTVAGSRNLGSGSITFDVGDYVVYNGTTWEKSDTTDSVPTVFGRSGNVVAVSGDYTVGQITGAAALTDLAGYQPLDSDLTAIAALSTTSTGRSLLAAADAAAIRTIAGAEVAGAAAAAQAASQPLDSDLTAIALLSTTTIGRSLLAAADAAALRTIIGAVIGTNVQAWDADLDALAAIAATNDDIIQRKSGAWVNRTVAQFKTDLALNNVDNVSVTTAGKGYINHGATAGTARPTGFASVEWVGSVEPTNAANGDTWVSTA